jgi:hypothetical protein
MNTTIKTLLENHIGEIEYTLAPTKVAIRKGDFEAIDSEGLIRPLYKVTIGKRKGEVGKTYESDVNDQREIEGKRTDFKSQKASGKSFVNGSNVVMQSDKEPSTLYISLRPLHSDTTIEFQDSNGKVLTTDQIDSYIPSRFSKPSRTPSATQGTDKAIFRITPKLDGFTSATLVSAVA